MPGECLARRFCAHCYNRGMTENNSSRYFPGAWRPSGRSTENTESTETSAGDESTDSDVDAVGTAGDADASHTGTLDIAGIAEDDHGEDEPVQEEEEVSRSRRVKIVILVVVLSLLALVIGGYLALRLTTVQSPDEESDGGPESPVEEMEPAEETVPPQDGESPFYTVFSDEDISIPDGSIDVSVDDDSFVFSSTETTMQALDASATGSSGADCVLTADTDICYAGYVESSDEDLGSVEVFAVKNIARNRLLEASTDVSEASVNGAEASFVGNVSVADDGDESLSSPFLAVADSRGSGFLILPTPTNNGSADIDDMESYQAHFQVNGESADED